MTYLILLPHMPAFIVTSLIETAGHKVAVFTVVFLATFKHRSHTDMPRNQVFLMKLILR